MPAEVPNPGRRDALKLLATSALAVAAMPLVGCEDPQEAWRTIPPADRLRALEKNQFPQFKGFNLINELGQAAAETRLAFMDCRTTLPQMTEGIQVLTPNDFLQEYQRVHHLSQLTPEQQQRILTRTLEFAARTDREEVYINDQVVKLVVQGMPSSSRSSYQRSGIDPEIAIIKQTIIHGQAHLNQSPETAIFNPVEVKLPHSNQIISIEGIESLALRGIDSTGNHIVISGSSETLTEIATEFLCGKAGSYIALPPYSDGSALLKPILEQGGLTTKDTLDVFHGKRSIKDMLDVIGSLKPGQNTNQQRHIGIQVLALIALTSNAILPFNIAQEGIQDLFGRRIYK